LLDNAGHESPIENVTVPFLPLPVTLVRFDATRSEKSVELSWSTTEETNSDRFEVQHSTNGKNWGVLGIVGSKGESTVLVHYRYTDHQPVAGENLYRLKMIDKDGTYAFSSIKNVRFDQNLRTVLYPNPASDKVVLLVDEPASIQRIELIGLNGQLLSDHRKTAGAVLSMELNLNQLKSGTYIIRITSQNGSIISNKLVKQ
jgi:hypothetical protein